MDYGGKNQMWQMRRGKRLATAQKRATETFTSRALTRDSGAESGREELDRSGDNAGSAPASLLMMRAEERGHHPFIDGVH
jgi:hypothetical protein